MPANDELAAAIVADLESGMSVDEVALRHEISAHDVTAIAESEKLPSRCTGSDAWVLLFAENDGDE